MLVRARIKLGFPMGRESATFWDKGTTGQAKNLAKGRDGIAKIWDWMDRDSQNPGRDAGQNGTEQKKQRSLSRDICSCPCPGTK